MCIACVQGMIVFLIIFILGVFAFADTFRAIERSLIADGRLEPPEFDEDANMYQKYIKTYIEHWQ